jgi:GNAT superfamily N-acetyltransferase
MPSLANLMEDYRNWRGRQDWEQGKGWQDFYSGDPVAQERFEQMSGFGTGTHGVGGLAGTITKQGLSDLIKDIESRGITLDAYASPEKNNITLSRLLVPENMRGMGLGSSAMSDIVNLADQEGATISLSPSTDFGATSINRLKDFYSRFGFVPNKGKYKDFSISESMYRPKK